jgi:hypothetical protein
MKKRFTITLPIDDMGTILVELEKTKMFKGSIGSNKYNGTWEWQIEYDIEHTAKLNKLLKEVK